MIDQKYKIVGTGPKGKIIELKCSHCEKPFQRPKKQHKYQARIGGENYKPYCSKECMIAGSITSQVNVECETCKKPFIKLQCHINKTEHNFCSRSCSASFHNEERKHNGYSLAGRTKNATCVECGIDCIVAWSVSLASAHCKKHMYNTNAIVDIICIKCGNIAQGSRQKQYCDSCYKVIMKEVGVRAGQASAAKQVRRSKNEIYFAELCQQEFTNVKTNDACFISKYGNWDADVVLHDLKIAVLWNGIWHFQQVRKGHSVKQVQSRDKIKMDVIKDNGYVAYVIADMGKHNKQFVEEQFELFKRFIKQRKPE